MYIYVRTYIHTYIHTYTYIHIYIHTYIHIHIYVCIYMYTCCVKDMGALERLSSRYERTQACSRHWQQEKRSETSTCSMWRTRS